MLSLTSHVIATFSFFITIAYNETIFSSVTPKIYDKSSHKCGYKKTKNPRSKQLCTNDIKMKQTHTEGRNELPNGQKSTKMKILTGTEDISANNRRDITTNTPGYRTRDTWRACIDRARISLTPFHGTFVMVSTYIWRYFNTIISLVLEALLRVVIKAIKLIFEGKNRYQTNSFMVWI